MIKRLSVILAVVVFLLVACGGKPSDDVDSGEVAPESEEDSSGVGDGAPPGGENGEAAADDAAPDGSAREVTFQAADGTTLSGTLFGLGDKVIVLSHMFPTEQTSWHTFAQAAAERGYLALTYDYRGYGATGGEKDIPLIVDDTRAAYDFAVSQGATQVILIGASMGGTASIKVAATAPDGLAGLVVLSSPNEFMGVAVEGDELAALTLPSLWMSARNDTVTRQLEDLYEGAAGPDKELWVFEGSGAHGTFIFDAPLDGQDLTDRLFAFLERVMPTG